MKLIIDIGNTLYKLAVYDENSMIYHTSMEVLNIDDVFQLNEKYGFKSAIVSSVRNDNDDLRSQISNKIPLINLNYETPLPIINNYTSKQTLGRDRIAGLVGAFNKFPNENVLIIDAGTCITYDFLNSSAEYYGGSISPGMNMRFKALHKFTGKLPLINIGDFKIPDLIGNSTQNSILSGVINGFAGEINSIISSYKSNNNQLKIIIAGGDYKYFDKLLKYKTFAAPYLVLEGLKGILDFNEKN